jgi:5'-nucleotidase / UDP-sugar diphosphatase
MNPWFWRSLWPILAGIALLGSGCSSKEVPEGTVVSVVYSSDVRGKLEGCGCKHNGGGITRRSAELVKARAKDPEVVYCDAGNFMAGTPEVDNSKGAISVAVYNQLKTDVANVSERELTFGIDAFKKAKQDAKFAFVSANLRANGGPVTEPFMIRPVKEAKVAFVGLCGTKEVMRTDSSLLPAGVTIDDPMATAKRIIPGLKGKADLIVVLSTCGDATDSLLAETYPSISLIVGGRSFRPNEVNPWVIGTTRVVRAPRDGREMGRMDLEFGAGNKVKNYNPAALAMETSGTSDDKMLALVRQYIPGFVDNPTEGVRITASNTPIGTASGH